MKKTLVLCLLIVPFYLSSEDEEFSYTYLGLQYHGGDSTGTSLKGSLGLPLNFYLIGSVERTEDQIRGSEYDKDSESLRLGIHFSIADIFNSVSYKDFNIEMARFLDFYFELGSEGWELNDILDENKSGTEVNLVGGIRLGDYESFELNIYLDKSKQAEIINDPITGKIQYGLGEETENTFGFRVVKNFKKNVALTAEVSDKSNSGGSFILGVRYQL